jgi:hypothetical protein
MEVRENLSFGAVWLATPLLRMPSFSGWFYFQFIKLAASLGEIT